MSIEPLRLRLKVAWFKNFLGLAIGQVNSSQHHFLTPYYFWPKTEAWEQLKQELAFKPWLKKEEKIRILNSAAEVMNFWKINRKTARIEDVIGIFKDVRFIKITV